MFPHRIFTFIYRCTCFCPARSDLKRYTSKATPSRETRTNRFQPPLKRHQLPFERFTSEHSDGAGEETHLTNVTRVQPAGSGALPAPAPFSVYSCGRTQTSPGEGRGTGAPSPSFPTTASYSTAPMLPCVALSPLRPFLKLNVLLRKGTI